jgi:hypothetical protein
MSRNTWTLTTIVAALLIAVWFGAAGAGFPQTLRSAHSEPAKAMPPMMVVVTDEGKLYHRPRLHVHPRTLETRTGRPGHRGRLHTLY